MGFCLHIKEVLEKLSHHYGRHRPDLLILVSDKEDQAFINSLDASCYILYKPVTINALYIHFDEILPAANEKEVQEDADGLVIPGISEEIRGAYVLLVEDNEINQLMASELLTMGGFKVYIASNGREAVEMVAQLWLAGFVPRPPTRLVIDTIREFCPQITQILVA